MAFIVQRLAVSPARIAIRLDPTVAVLKAADHRRFVAAEDIVAQAHAEAEHIVAAARDAFEAQRERGYREGWDAARREQTRHIVENVGVAVAYFSRIERDAIDLVMQAVTKIVFDFDDEEKVAVVVRAALTAVRSQKQVTLRLHPDQSLAVRRRLDRILTGFPSVGFADVVPDGRVAMNACILESDLGLVEASLEGQLGAIQDALYKVMGVTPVPASMPSPAPAPAPESPPPTPLVAGDA